MSKKFTQDRRAFLMNALTASGAIGLRSLLLGLPPAFLVNRSMAASNSAQFLVYACSHLGEPMNANAPGSYVSGVRHPNEFKSPVNFKLGSFSTKAAAPWAGLSGDLRARMNFIHLDTRTSAHPEAANVLRINGSLKSIAGNGVDMLPSAIAQLNAPQLGTMNDKPILLGNIGSVLTYEGKPQPLVAPSKIKDSFSLPKVGANISNSATRQMRNFRDQAIDNLYADIKANGNSAERKFLDDYSLSSMQADQVADNLISSLNGLGKNDYWDQMITAAALISANIAPAAIVRLGFGGDNHSAEKGAGIEVKQTLESIEAIQEFWDRIKGFGKKNQVTFCFKSVFGRTLDNRKNWRDHNGSHTVAMMFGPNVKAGVTGGLDTSKGLKTGISAGINSKTGRMANPDISRNDSLASTAKTMMHACGISEADVNERITSGKIIKGALS